jgi:precorrin-6Y C5,15-methyltransferase (decarboxylating)
VVVLATGDPMHFGIGVTLAKRVPIDEMRVHPGVSAFSLAAARMGWPLAGVECVTLHGRPVELLAGLVAPGRRMFILSHDGSTPALVAKTLRELGFGQSRLAVLEHMGGARERRIDGRADTLDRQQSADLNTIALECAPDAGEQGLPLGFGIEDGRFRHDGKITKRETRAATLAALSPRPGQLLWDVGAGSGSIAIEWLRQHRTMRAIAIECDPTRAEALRWNAARLGTPGLRIVEGRAPSAFGELPTPDAVFIGGGLNEPGLIEAAWSRLIAGGRIVANAVTLESEAALIAARENQGGEMNRITVSRLTPIGGYHGWKPLMPVTQWSQRKP